MKTKIFFALLFWGNILFAQDYIKFKSGDVLNCKIISANKNEIVFKKDSSVRKVPTNLVIEFKYDSQIEERLLNDTIIKLAEIINSPLEKENNIKDVNIYLAGKYKLKSLHQKYIGAGVAILGSALILIAVSPPVLIFTGAIVLSVAISSEVNEYKSAQHLRNAGLNIRTTPSQESPN